MPQNTCILNIMQIPLAVLFWHRKQIFPSFLDHPVCILSQFFCCVLLLAAAGTEMAPKPKHQKTGKGKEHSKSKDETEATIKLDHCALNFPEVLAIDHEFSLPKYTSGMPFSFIFHVKNVIK